MGIVIVVIFMLSYYKLSTSESRMMTKEELVAQKYLEEKLGIDLLDVYIDNFSGSLRGEDTKVKAINQSGNFIIMIYINNKIISYDFNNEK